MSSPRRAPTPGHVYNVGGGSRASVREALEIIGCALGSPLDVRYLDSQIGDVRDTGADISAARRDLDFDPEVDLAKGLTAQLEWALARAR